MYFYRSPVIGGGDQVRKRLDDAYRRIGGEIRDVVTFREVSQIRTGRYLGNLIEAITNSSYVVYDITSGATSGVCVEVGIASGLRKPHSFCWFSDLKDGWGAAFSQEYLPEELRSADVKIWPPRNPGAFYDWLRTNVHTPTFRKTEMCGFQASEARCECKEVVRPPNRTVYLRMQPVNHSIGERLVDLLRERDVTVRLGDRVGSVISRNTCKSLRSADAAIFDISGVDVRRKEPRAEPRTPRYKAGSAEVLSLVEVGYALGAGIPHACVFTEEYGPIQSPMLPEDRSSIPGSHNERKLRDTIDWFFETILLKVTR